MGLRTELKKLLRRCGYDLIKVPKVNIGANPFDDMQRFTKSVDEPVIFDVGANVGQSVSRFIKYFPSASMHSFEPSPSTFEKLELHCRTFPRVTAWNYGVGASNTTLTFHENNYSDMSSFLAPSTTSWGKIVRKTDAPVVTLDTFAKDHNINFIHILKSDTQGFDYEVFKGASQLMDENRIALIYFEIIFSNMYENLPQFHEVLQYLEEKNFDLVTFYKSNFQNELVSWTDALFINRAYNKTREVP